jgi:hypothetical protein
MPPSSPRFPAASPPDHSVTRTMPASVAARRPAERAALDIEIEKFGRSRPGLPGVVPLGADDAGLGGQPGLLARPRRAGLLPFGTA